MLILSLQISKPQLFIENKHEVNFVPMIPIQNGDTHKRFFDSLNAKFEKYFFLKLDSNTTNKKPNNTRILRSKNHEFTGYLTKRIVNNFS